MNGLFRDKKLVGFRSFHDQLETVVVILENIAANYERFFGST
jgi:hypothetical protein